MKPIFMIVMLGIIYSAQASHLSKAEKNVQEQKKLNEAMWTAINEENENSLPTLKKLFASKAKIKPDINDTTDKGHTPLFLAAAHNNDTIIAQFLIEHGAKINIQDKQGMTPLFVAVQAHFLHQSPKDNIRMIRLLAATGAKDSIVDKQGKTKRAINYAVNDFDEIKAAIEEGKQEYALVIQAYEERKKAAHRQLQQHVIPDLATIITEYAFEEGSPQDLLEHAGATEKQGCVIS